MQVLENLVAIILPILAQTFYFYHKNKNITLGPSLEALNDISRNRLFLRYRQFVAYIRYVTSHTMEL